MTKRTYFTTLAAVALVAGVVFGRDLIGYQPMGAAPSVSARIPGAQSGTWTSPLDPKPTNGDPTINVTPLLSAASATVGVEVGLYHSNGAAVPTYTLLKRVVLGTATAPSADVATIGTGFWYVAEGFGVDSRGATTYDVRVRTAPSSGNAAFLRWTHGASGEPNQ